MTDKTYRTEGIEIAVIIAIIERGIVGHTTRDNYNAGLDKALARGATSAFDFQGSV